jgi:flagellum-specific ATP synthase
VITADARKALAAFANMEELIRIGAYRSGADPELDRAIRLNPGLEAFLAQDKQEVTSLDEGFVRLQALLAEGAAA